MQLIELMVPEDSELFHIYLSVPSASGLGDEEQKNNSTVVSHCHV